MEPLLPLFVKLAGRPVLVVGAGAMGASRARQLADAGARVIVVAPEVRPEAEAAAAVVHRRPFAPADLDGMWLVVAAAPPEVNRAVAEAAEARPVLVNAVDDPARASAYFPGVVRHGGATIAISTDGRAPALAGLLREALQSLLPEDLAAWLEAAEGLREAWKAEGVPLAERRPLLLQRLNALYATAERGGGATQERPRAGPALPGSSA